MAEDEPYPFPNKPAGKSSTNVLCKRGEAVACPGCGCRTKSDGTVVRPFANKRPKCECRCHPGGR